MSKAVVILGTLDTKAEEVRYVAERIAANGGMSIVVDTGILDTPGFSPDIDRHTVAAAAGTSIADLADSRDRGAAVSAMAQGATQVVADLITSGRAGGVIGIGGSGNATISCTAMRALPVGIPKLMVTTIASGDTRPYVGTSDITMMYSVVDISGLNRLSRKILSNAAAAIVGMVAAEEPPTGAGGAERPLLAATMFGVTTPCVTAVREGLEKLGYEVLVFHATGVGGRSMEALIHDGFVTGVLDLTTTELADEIAGGALSAGPDRLEAAGRARIPQVVSLGALDMVNFGPLDTVPPHYRQRLLYQHNPAVTLMRTTIEENEKLGELIATKLNRAQGPVALLVPRKGVSLIDVEGGTFYDPAADAALFDALRQRLEPGVELIELDAAINDSIFAQTVIATFDRLYRQWKEGGVNGS